MTRTITLVLLTVSVGCVGHASLGGTGQDNAPAAPHQPTAADPDLSDDALSGDWSLAERSSWKRIYAQADQYRNLLNSSCNSAVDFDYEHESFRDRLAATDANHTEDWQVSAIFSAIRNICLEGEDGVYSVSHRIITVHFARAPTGHSLDGENLTVGLDLDANPREFVNDFSAWLRGQL